MEKAYRQIIQNSAGVLQIKLLKVIESESTTFQHIVDNWNSALLFFGVLRFLGLQLELVEALAVGAGDEALRYESMRVDTLDDSENRHRFEASRHNNEHFDLMFAIPSLTVDNGASAAHIEIDGVGDPYPVVRDNEELDSLTVGIDHLVAGECSKEENYQTVDNGVDRMEYEVARRDNAEIDIQHCAPYRERRLPRHYRGYDIGASGRSVMYENHTQREARDYAGYRNAHERLARYESFGKSRHYYRLKNTYEQTQAGRAEERAQHELLADNLESHRQKNEVYGILRDGHRNSGGEIDESAQTGHASDNHLVRQNETAERHRIEQSSEYNEKIVARRHPKLAAALADRVRYFEVHHGS